MIAGDGRADFWLGRRYNEMMRPLACLLLISSLLAQGAALPHSHDGSDQPADHDLRPHFHLSGSHHSHHVHAVAPERLPTAQPRGVAYCYGLPACDHDHDAVYVNSSGDMNLMERGSACLAFVNCWQCATNFAGPDASAAHPQLAPVAYGDSVPIFLASTRLLV
jgi:hypothetical protein